MDHDGLGGVIQGAHHIGYFPTPNTTHTRSSTMSIGIYQYKVVESRSHHAALPRCQSLPLQSTTVPTWKSSLTPTPAMAFHQQGVRTGNPPTSCWPPRFFPALPVSLQSLLLGYSVHAMVFHSTSTSTRTMLMLWRGI